MEDCLLMSFQEKLGIHNIHLLLTGRSVQSDCKSHRPLTHLARNVGMFALPRSLNILNYDNHRKENI